MNWTWAAVAWLAVCVLQACLELLLEALNLRRLRLAGGRVPPAFAGRLRPELLARAEDYTAAKTRFHMARLAWMNAWAAALVFGGGLDALGRWTGAWDWPFPAAGAVFFVLLVLARGVLDVPFSLVFHFRLERRFGFSRLTPGLWLSDWLKTQLLAAALTALLAGGGLLLVWAAPAWWWAWAWLCFGAVNLLLAVVWPSLIAPWFHRFRPLADTDLAGRIRALLTEAGLRVSAVLVMDASRRSRHSNAYFAGLGASKRIVLYDTLLAGLDADEILAVLAHEAGHWRLGHAWLRLGAAQLAALAALAATAYAVAADLPAAWFGLGAPVFYVQAALAGLLLHWLGLPATAAFSALTRRQERRADGFAAALLERTAPLRSALIKLSLDNLTNLHPHPWYAAVYYRHPPILERLRRLDALAVA